MSFIKFLMYYGFPVFAITTVVAVFLAKHGYINILISK